MPFWSQTFDLLLIQTLCCPGMINPGRRVQEERFASSTLSTVLESVTTGPFSTSVWACALENVRFMFRLLLPNYRNRPSIRSDKIFSLPIQGKPSSTWSSYRGRELHHSSGSVFSTPRFVFGTGTALAAS
jgi:hypothetical protein